MIDDILTERAIAWLRGIAFTARLGMLLFIFYALTTHMPATDAGAVTFAFYLVARALLRMRAST